MCCDKGRNMQIRGVWQKAVQNRIRVMKSTSPDRTRGYVQFPSPRALRARDLSGISIFRRSQFRLPLSSSNCSLIELPLPVARPLSAPIPVRLELGIRSVHEFSCSSSKSRSQQIFCVRRSPFHLPLSSTNFSLI